MSKAEVHVGDPMELVANSNSCSLLPYRPVLDYIAVLCVVTTSIRHVSPLALGEICSTDSECVADVENSECGLSVPCTEKGHCQCKSGYGNQTGDGCDRLLRSYGQQCDSNTTYCNGVNEECHAVTNNCTCDTWYTWNTVAWRCIEIEKAVHTEPCGSGIFADDCLVTEADGGLCDETCMCKPGFTMNWKDLTCDSPIYGDACMQEPSCVLHFDPANVSNDRSTVIPSCQSHVCSCPLSHEHKYVNRYHFCLHKVVNGTILLADGEPCEQFKDCESSFCYTCPGETQPRCYANPTAYTDNQACIQAEFLTIAVALLVALATVT